MLYVMTFSWQAGLTPEQRNGAFVRRAQWQYPEGVRVVGEYWTVSDDPAVLVVFEAEGYAPLFEVAVAWGDVFKIAMHPAITAEEGLRTGPEMMARRRV